MEQKLYAVNLMAKQADTKRYQPFTGESGACGWEEGLVLGRKKADGKKEKKRKAERQAPVQRGQDIRLEELCSQPESLSGIAKRCQRTDTGLFADAVPSGIEVITLELSETKAVTQQLPKKRGTVEVGTASVIGSRKSQQDSVFGYESQGLALGIVCDGMGGLAGGEIASRAALESLADAWFAQKDIPDIPSFFRREAVRADRKVYGQERADGSRLEAGTTIVAAAVRDNELYWLSVGDSRLYFIRGMDILSLNIEHNYRLELNTLLREGKLTAQEYAAREYQAEALISYLGIGNLSLMDVSTKPYPLADGDIMLLTSDGLYRSLKEDEILEIVLKHKKDMQKAAEALTAAVKGRKKQDNTSVVILRYHSG